MDDATSLEYFSVPAVVVRAPFRPRLPSPVYEKPEGRTVDVATTNAYSAVHPKSAVDVHFAKLKEIQFNPRLWPEEADAPSAYAIQLAGIALESFDRLGFAPSRVVASAEGGVGVYFVHGDKYADIEFFNSGEILGVTSNRRDRPVVWEVEQSSDSFSQAAVRIRQFFETSETDTDDSKRSVV